jgi:hypothetical protein
MGEIFVLALASALWPLLLAVVVIAFGSAQPMRLLASFLAGGLLATVVVGVAVVHLIQTTSIQIGSRQESRAVLPLLLGFAAIGTAIFLARRSPPPRPLRRASAEEEGAGRLARWLDGGVWVAFLGGIVLNLFPGALPLVALKDIAELDYGFAATVGVVLAFYLVMFMLVEIPLVAYLISPTRTADVTRRFNVWLRANRRRLGIAVLLIAGAYLVVRGLLALGG